MDKSAILGEIALETVQKALAFAFYNFPVAMQFFHKLPSHPCSIYIIYMLVLGLIDLNAPAKRCMVVIKDSSEIDTDTNYFHQSSYSNR